MRRTMPPLTPAPSRARLAFGALVALALTSSASAVEIFSVTATFAEVNNFALGEFASRLEVCATTNFAALSNPLKANCIHHLVSSSAVCSSVPKASGTGTDFVCVINGVPIAADDISFACAEDVCPLSDPTLSDHLEAAMPAATCAPTAVEGFNGACYPSGMCQVKMEPDTFTGSFGEFCPSSTGEYCCGANTSRNTTTFNGQDPTLGEGTLDYLRTMDHVADLSFNIHYEVSAPALLKIVVDVPYVKSDTTVTYTEDGLEKSYIMCPSTYMIDFEDPITTFPRKEEGYARRSADAWLPLWHFPTQDLVGRPRSPCGNYDMSYASDVDFKNKFMFPDSYSGGDRLTYGSVPAVDASIWDPSLSTDGIPHEEDTLWKMSQPDLMAGRVNYTSGSSRNGGFFDLLKTYAKCVDYQTKAPLVRRNVEADPTLINGVSYPVESYEWTMSVCQTGFFGANCADPTKLQMYAKTCARVPASFSVTPQQLSHVVTSPVTENLVSKTFLQGVDSTRSNCQVGHERVAVTLTLVILAKEYTIFTQDVHDVLQPKGIFDGTQDDIFINNKTTIATVDAFLASNPENEGVYKLKNVDVTVGGTSLYYEKLVVLTKCYNTGFDATTGKRAFPTVFADAIEDGNDKVTFDVEVTVKKLDDSVKNTLNLRILATKDTFNLRSADTLSMLEVTADHVVYGSYEVARSDTAAALASRLSFENGLEMSGGDQICSKHQAKDFDAQMSTMTPNAVGACMLTNFGVTKTDSLGVTLYGTSVSYRTAGMTDPATYVFGCFNDWIDIESATLMNGIYEFPNQLTRLTGTHDSIFWFVQQEELNEENLAGTNEKLSDRFGTGLFYYNSTSGIQVVKKSTQMQLDTVTASLPTSQLTPGCVTTAGNLMAGCNLVCFDLVAGLLSDPSGQTSRNVLVHHISVATIATDDQSTNDKKYGGRKSRRMLLETATAVGDAPGTLSQKKNAKSITVAAKAGSTDPGAPPGPPGSPNAGGNSGNAAYDGDMIQRDGNGPKNLQLITYPLIFVGVPVVVLVIVFVISTTIMSNFKIQKSYQNNDMPAKGEKERGGGFGLDPNDQFDKFGNYRGDSNQNTPLMQNDSNGRGVGSSMGRRGGHSGR
jgi:hypothetical protein